MTTEQMYALARTLIPTSFHLHTWVAGGFAISPSQAEDMDVWVFTDEAGFHALKGHAQEAWGKMDVLFDLLQPAGAGTDENTYPNSPEWAALGLRLIGKVRANGAHQAIQIFAVTAPNQNVYGLLSVFDISTHQWAVSLAEPEVKTSVPSATLPSQPPVVTRYTLPQRTIPRLIKLSMRYGWDYRQNLGLARLTELQMTMFATAGVPEAEALPVLVELERQAREAALMGGALPF